MPGNGFKVADAYADFHIDVDSEIGRAAARLKAKGAEFARMGENAGKAFSAGFGRGVDLDQHLTRKIEEVRKRTNQIERVGNQAGEGYGRGFRQGVNLRPAMTEQLAVVRTARAAFGREGKQAGDAYAKGFGGRRLSGPSVGSGAAGAEASGEESARAMARGFRRGSGDMDSATTKVAQRTEAKFSALKFLGLSQGLPAAAAAGVLATTGIVAGAGALFIGLGVAGAMGAEKVSKSWIDTANVVEHGITALSESYEGPLVTASEMVGDSFVRSTGLIQRGMANAAGGVEILTGAGLDLAENALPGIVTASGRLTPVLQGVRTMAGQVGAGFGEMAANASEGSVAAGKSAGILGDTLRMVEARAGSLVANLANASSGPLNAFRYTLDQITGAALDLTSKGSGALGFFSGFQTSANGAITVARGLLGALNALPPQVTSLAGSFSATSMILSKVGVDVGKPWEGLGAKIKGAGKELVGTEKFAAKAGTALGGLAAGAVNPATLAVAGLSIGLELLGDRQQKAAEAAAEHRENVRSLTDAIRQDNGVLGEHAATQIANNLATKNASSNLGIANVAMGQATVAAMGNTKAMRDVTQQSNAWIQGLADQGLIAQKNANGLKGINQGLLENGGSYDDVAQKVAGFNESLAALHPAQQQQLQALLNGTGAIGEQAKATREAYNGYQLQEQGLTGLTRAQIEARDATIDHTKAIYDQQNAGLGYRGAVQTTKEAMDKYNTAMKDGKISGDDETRTLLALENAFGQQEQAAYNAAYANSTAKTEQEKVKEATLALNRETVNLANSFTGPLPASMAQTIGKMSVTEAQAAGLRIRINDVGQAVYVLPNGKEVKLTGDNKQALDAVQAVQNALNAVHNKEVTLHINQTTTYSGTSRGNTPSYNGGARMNATGNLFVPRGGDGAALPDVRFYAGGGLPALRPLTANRAEMISPNTWRVVGDNLRVPELFAPLNGSQRTADLIMQAAQHEGLLNAANSALAAARAGTRIEEDFSFAGQTAATGGAVNDQLAALMYSQTHADAGAKDFQAAAVSWLQGYVAQQTAVVRAIPGAVASAVANLGPSVTIPITPPSTMDYDLLAEIVSRKIFLRGR